MYNSISFHTILKLHMLSSFICLTNIPIHIPCYINSFSHINQHCIYTMAPFIPCLIHEYISHIFHLITTCFTFHVSVLYLISISHKMSFQSQYKN
ncbi:Glutamine--tRNA ligase [Gossypium arboreum]|uniref:Glutamine--tRNA ligase n=1 Tax=Gossypium arboreum TaxID=29729 RepID=A0A0B0NX28_GOSAR|nr:Glutamine--tRNA ligase [Gossypium arboreum]